MAEEEVDAEAAGLRPFWSGTITFGLVTVPVSLYAATRPRSVGLKMMGPDDSPVRRRYVCSKDGEVLDANEIVRGYEIEKGKYVVVTDDELEAIEPRKSREIDLQLFVDRDEIAPIYYQRAYFLIPSGGTNKAYRLLAEVMEKKNQAGIATFVMRAKEYLVAIIAENGILRAETLRFADEVRAPEDVGLPKPASVTAAEVKKFEAQVTKGSKKLDLREFLDDYTERLEKLVAKKEKKKEAIVRAPVEEDEEEGDGEVVDLLAMLSRSLGQSGKGAAATRKPARKAPATRKAASSKKAAATKKAASKRK